MKWLPGVVTGVIRFFAELPENIVLLGRRTVFSHRRTRKEIPVGNAVTWRLGRLLNAFARLLNATLLRRKPIGTDFVALFAAWRDEMSDTARRVTRSVSFGLLLLCVSMYIIFAYLLSR